MKACRLAVAVFLVLLVPIAAGAPELQDWLGQTGLSRGMSLFFAGLVVVAALPFMNRWVKPFALVVAAVGLGRGMARIASEQDLVRVLYSVGPGLVLGLQLALVLVLASVIVGEAMALTKGGTATKTPTRFKRGGQARVKRRKG